MAAPVNAGNGTQASQDQQTLDKLREAQSQALAMQTEMNILQMQFQGKMSALKAVSEAYTAGNDARNKSIEKIGASGR